MDPEPSRLWDLDCGTWSQETEYVDVFKKNLKTYFMSNGGEYLYYLRSQ